MTALNEEKGNQNKTSRILLKTLVSCILIAISVRGLDWNKFLNILNNIDAKYLLLIVPLYFLNIVCSVLRWRVILNQMGTPIAFWKLFKIYLISSFWGNFLPSTIGGDGYRFLALRTISNLSQTSIITSLLLDRMYGYITLVFLYILTTLFYWQEIQEYRFLLNMNLGIFGLLIVAFLGFIVLRRFFYKDNVEVNNQWANKLLTKGKEIFHLLTLQNAKTIILCTGYSTVFIMTTVFAWQCYYLAVGFQVDIGIILYTTSLIGIVGVLPITLNGVGIVEFFQVLILNWQMVSTESALLASFLTRIMTFFLTIPGSILYLVDKNKINDTTQSLH